MKLFLLTSLTMLAFAANSVLTRFALADHLIGPAAFAMVRVGAGALMLGVLVFWKERRVADFSEVSALSVLGLATYVLGFSYAYISLETGIGALILFGGVQITMFAGALISGERPSRWRVIGALVAMAGLVYLLQPSARAPDIKGSILMGVAAAGWGYYSLYGRKVGKPLQATAGNFLLALPLALLVGLTFGDAQSPALTGIALAIIAGAITSGLGYALWYGVLPKLDATLAAVAQLTVPMIALAGGVLFLSEALTLQFTIASALILGGVGLSMLR
jgi:drug/metabolite transporter (DMT)-like permease